MKRFVANLKASNLAALIPGQTTSPRPGVQRTLAAHTTASTGLQPKYTVPPVPHPCPYDHIAVLVASDGLLLRPHFDPPTRPESHLRIAWGKPAKVESLDEAEGLDWSNAVIIYGLVGILELFSSTSTPFSAKGIGGTDAQSLQVHISWS